jgi:hypothetical protein
VEIAFMAGFPGECKAQVFDVTESAVDEFGAAAAGPRGEVFGFDERDAHPTHRCIAEDRRPCDTSADDEQIEPFLR